MIDDAYPWKLELLRLAHELKTEFAEPNLFPIAGLGAETQQIFLVERLAFTTGLALRKLAEAGKVSLQFLSTSIEYQRHAIQDPTRAPDQINMHKTLNFYKEAGTTSRISYGGFANMLIHSKALIPLIDEDRAGRSKPYGFGVTSDRTHLSHLSIFTINDVDQLLDRLEQDDVVLKMMLRDGSGRAVTVGSCTQMDHEELLGYLDRSPRKETADEIRQFIADRFL